MLNTAWSPFSLATSSMTGIRRFWNSPCSSFCRSWTSACALVLRELDVALQLVDVLVELRARGVVQDGAAGVALRRQRLQLLVLLVDLRRSSCLVSPVSFFDASLPAADVPAIMFTSMNAILASCGNGTGGAGFGAAGWAAAGGVAGGVCGLGAPAGGAVCANEGAASAAINAAARIEDFKTLIE